MTPPGRSAAIPPVPDVEALLANLYGATHAVRDHLRSELVRTGLSPPTFWALHHIVTGGPRNVGQIAAACVVTSANASTAAEDLVAADLVRRARAGGDRRVVLLTPTPRGRSVHRAVCERVSRRLATSLDGFSPADLDTATRVLRRLSRAGAALPPEAEVLAA